MVLCDISSRDTTRNTRGIPDRVDYAPALLTPGGYPDLESHYTPVFPGTATTELYPCTGRCSSEEQRERVQRRFLQLLLDPAQLYGHIVEPPGREARVVMAEAWD